jgi:hypothetical protein
LSTRRPEKGRLTDRERITARTILRITRTNSSYRFIGLSVNKKKAGGKTLVFFLF